MQWHPPGEPIGLAVSGGPDSLALMLLGHGAMGDLCEVATVDHGLRPASASEAAYVASVAARLGLRHETLAVAVKPGNLQAEARAARYAALSQWSRRRGLASIATAHHADDQAETVLMRLNRGSGLAGLSGIRQAARSEAGAPLVVRPLLTWRKQELERIAHEAGLAPARDPSNADPRFDRARVRARLAGADWLDPEGIAASAAHLAEAERLLRLIVAEDFAACVDAGPEAVLYHPHRTGRGADYELLHALVCARVFTELLGGAPRFSEVRRLTGDLARRQPGTLAGYRVTASEGPHGPMWTFRREPPRGG